MNTSLIAKIKDAVAAVPAADKRTHNETKALDHLNVALELLEKDTGKTTDELAAEPHPASYAPRAKH